MQRSSSNSNKGMGQKISAADFEEGIDRLLALKVESRLPTEGLWDSYCRELGQLTLEAWTYCVDLAMSTQTTLPAPSWFLENARKYEESMVELARTDEEAALRRHYEAMFPPDVALANIKKLNALAQGVKSI